MSFQPGTVLSLLVGLALISFTAPPTVRGQEGTEERSDRISRGFKGAGIGGATAVALAISQDPLRDDALIYGVLGMTAGTVTGILLSPPTDERNTGRGMYRGLGIGALVGAVALSYAANVNDPDEGFNGGLFVLGAEIGGVAGAITGATLGTAGDEGRRDVRWKVVRTPSGGVSLVGSREAAWFH